MPPVVTAVGAFIVKVFTSKLILYQILRTVIINYALGAIAKALAGKPKSSNIPIAQKVQIRSTVAPREIVYGEVRKSGAVIYYTATGDNNKYLWYVLAIAGHQLESMTDVWLDDVLIDNSNINGSTGEVTSGKYAGKVYIWKKLGTSAQTALTELDNATSEWTSSHKGKGVALLFVRMERDQEIFPNGPPAQFFVKVKGRRVYDPRLDSTNGGSGSHRLNDATTWAWSDNSALCRADYMTGGSLFFDTATPDTRMGMRIPTSRIDWAVVAASANECDETPAIPPSTSQKRYTCNVVLSTADSHETNTDKIDATMIGQHVYVGGKYRILAGKFDTATHTLTDADLAGGWEMIGNAGLKDVSNAVSGIYFDPARKYAEVPCRVRTDSSYETEDGGSSGAKQRLRTIDLSGVNNEYRAQRICEVHKRATRDQTVVKFTCGPSMLKVAPWETFTVSLAEMPSWMVGKTFRAQEIELDLNNPPKVIITGKVESSSVWTDPAEGDYLTGNTGSPSAQFETPDAPASLSAAGGQDVIQFTWPAAPVFFPHWRYELWEYSAATPFSSATKIWEGIATGAAIPRTSTTAAYFWLRIRGSRNASGTALYSDTTPAVDGLQAAATSITTGFRATVSPGSHFKLLIGTGQGSTTNQSTVTPINGVAPYTYSWARLSGSTKITAAGPTSQTSGFQVTGGNSLADQEQVGAVFRCTVTDSTGGTPLTTTVDVNITFLRDDSAGS